jgi:hypothetical protein
MITELKLYRHQYNNPADAKRDFLCGLPFNAFDTKSKVTYHDLSVIKGAGIKTIALVWHKAMPSVLLKTNEI